jgi:hypothetical protein
VQVLLHTVQDHHFPVREVAFQRTTGPSTNGLPYLRFQDHLFSSLENEQLVAVELLAHRTCSKNLGVSPEASTWINVRRGIVYLGFLQDSGWEPQAVLERLYHICFPSIPDLAYGIGYTHPQDKGPSLFTIGMLATAGGPKSQYDDPVFISRTGRWLHEMIGARRYLDGWVRDVYPVQLLSSAHVQALASVYEGNQNIPGRLIQLSDSHWLWAIANDQIDPIRGQLTHAGILICC